MARALASSQIVPQTYQGESNIGNCVIALEIASRIGATVLAVMQNLYVVHGRPAWSSQFLISCLNASRRFSPLRYKTTGTRDTDSWGCIAWATDKAGETLESPEVNIAMAKAEGWYNRNGSKWKTMPELMLRYRAATLFTRLYAPELTMGIQTDDEVIDVPATTVSVEPKRPLFAEAAPASEPAKVVEKTLTPQQDFARFICDESGVSFDDFRSFLVTKGFKAAGIDDWQSFDDVPEIVITELRSPINSKTLAELIRKFGKVASK